MIQYRQSNLNPEIVDVISDTGIVSHTSKLNDAYIKFIQDGGTLLPALPTLLRYSEYQNIQLVRLITNDATVTEIARWTLSLRTMYVAHLELDLINITAAGIPVRHMEATITAKRINAGALLVSTPTVKVDQPDVASALPVAAVVSGNDFIIRVTGINGQTIHWHLSGRIKIITNDGKV